MLTRASLPISAVLQLRERNADKILRMGRGELSVYDELFRCSRGVSVYPLHVCDSAAHAWCQPRVGTSAARCCWPLRSLPHAPSRLAQLFLPRAASGYFYWRCC